MSKAHPAKMIPGMLWCKPQATASHLMDALSLLKRVRELVLTMVRTPIAIENIVAAAHPTHCLNSKVCYDMHAT